ncbi:hypothetical protein HK097_010060, partial [Rhizophlyctis rosea]
MRELLRGLSSDALAAAVGTPGKKSGNTVGAGTGQTASGSITPKQQQSGKVPVPMPDPNFRLPVDRQKEKPRETLSLDRQKHCDWEPSSISGSREALVTSGHPQPISNDRHGSIQYTSAGNLTPSPNTVDQKPIDSSPPPATSSTGPTGLIAKLTGLSFKSKSHQHLHETPQSSPPPSNLGSTTSLNEKPPTTASLLSQRRPVSITPTQLTSYISYALFNNTAQPKGPFPPETSLLLIDLRNVADYNRVHIRTAVNVNLPPIMIKRFRRGSVSSFQVEKFLTAGNESQEIYDAWKRGPNGGSSQTDEDSNSTGMEMDGDESKKKGNGNWTRAMVVYEEDMNERNKETDAWALINTLATGWVDDGEGKMFFGWLKGGLKAFVAMDSTEDLVVRGASSTLMPSEEQLSVSQDGLAKGPDSTDSLNTQHQPFLDTNRFPQFDEPIPIPRRKQSAF